MKWRWVVFAGLLLSVASGGVWFLYQEGDVPSPVFVKGIPIASVPRSVGMAEVGPSESDALMEPDDSLGPIVWPDGAVPGDLVFSFKNRTDLENFLRDARRAGLTGLEVIPELNLVRVRTDNDDEARRALNLAGDAGRAFNPFVASPEIPPEGTLAGRHLPFGDQALAWMGVPEDNSSWGEGVRIAVLDTGVGEHPSLDGASITRLSMLEEGAEVGTHGTAMASLLVGQNEIRGIVPAADLLSIQVLGADGSGNGFDLARGIIAAVQGGAHVINLSLGTPTHSEALLQAVLFAQQRGVVLVAASGNNGGGKSLYPAGYANVISVGGADANGQRVGFSNGDANLSFIAPGYGLFVAGPDGKRIVMDGTSPATTFVTGAAARISKSASSGEIAAAMEGIANDSGLPGHDGYHGHGSPDMQRWEWKDQPNFSDLAVPAHSIDFSRGSPEMVVTVQNQGNQTVGGIVLEVNINGRYYRVPIGTLGKGAVGSGRIPVTFGSDEEIQVVSVVSAPGVKDLRSRNNSRESVLYFKSD